MKHTGKAILTVLAAGMFFLCTAVTAAAVTVDFHGKGSAGVLTSSSAYILGGESNDSTTFGAGKFRFRAEVGTDDGRAKMVYGFETGANNFGGSDWNYSGDSVDFENRFAYVQAVMPGMDQITARGGLQKSGVNHWLWTETAAGLTLHGKGGINWSAGWFRGLEEGWGQDDAIETDLYILKADFRPGSDISVGGFGVYAMDFGDKRNIQEDADQYWLGLTGKMDGPVFAAFDLIYQGGDAGLNGDMDVSAYLANLTMGARVSDNLKVSANGLYVSGDDDPADGDLEAFQSIDADVKVGQIFFKDGFAGSIDRFVDDQFGSTMPIGLRNNGLVNLALEGDMKLDDKNSLRAAIRYLATAEDCPIFGEDELGYELDLWYAYKFNQNLTLKLEGAYLFVGDLAEQMFEDDDDVYQVAAGMEFSF